MFRTDLVSSEDTLSGKLKYKHFEKESTMLAWCSLFFHIRARLRQALWTTTPKNFYHPNQFSTRCVVESFNY